MNTDEYLNQIHRIIRDNFRSTDPTGGMPVATIAYLAKQTIGSDHARFGFLKFKDVLQSLEASGLVKTGKNSKGAFSVFLPDRLHSAGAPLVCVHPQTKFRRLRRQVWFAFVSSTPTGKRYLNRETGEVRIGVLDEPSAEEWAEISPVDSETERAMACEFARNNAIVEPETLQTLDSDRWYVGFPQSLASRDPFLAGQWNRQRSLWVIECVEKWCEQNNIEHTLVFEQESALPALPDARPGGGEQSQLRRLLLAALARLSTEELLQVSFPARHLVAVMRPDLLD